MSAGAPIEAAWKELETFSSSADGLRLSEVRAIFAIGSMPGGYFRPGQSDLDVLVLFKGAPGKWFSAQPSKKKSSGWKRLPPKPRRTKWS